MKRLVLTILIASLAVMGLSSPVIAEMATMDDALTVANNWITLIIEKKGDWGGSETAEVEEIQEFKRGERVIGYFCHVKPKGYIVISLHKELVPVKAYSAKHNLDPESDEGMADLVKGGLERVLNSIEEQLGPVETLQTTDLEKHLEVNYRQSWQQLTDDVDTFKTELETMNYQECDVMLTSAWHQKPPYNNQCPLPDTGELCDWSNYCDYNHNAKVGCTATAGAQIMRYWNWPPYGVSPYDDDYDWPNMPDAFTAPGGTVPPCNWPLVQVNAVAELCSEVGQACGMQYLRCSASACPSENMVDVYKNFFRYSTACQKLERQDYTDGDWFNLMKDQFNLNRPVQYRFEVLEADGTVKFSHGVVGDGWREIGDLQEFHVNYGHGDEETMWYTLEHSYFQGNVEYMLVDIYPAQALESSIAGTYTRDASFPYRYFDQDATGNSATFENGQYLQFLPGITVTCTSTTGGSIRFEGSSSDNTWLFTRGDRTKGVRIYDGAIKMNRYGGVKIE